MRNAPMMPRRGRRRGMTLVEVIMAITILSMAMLGLANFSRLFQHKTQTSSDLALGGDLATQKIETIKGWKVYSTLVTTYNNITETFAADPVYTGFTRYTKVVQCSGCPTATNDYVTVTVKVTGRSLPTTGISKTTIIAAF
ncbi:MAG: prepilin-type N-terminal cleavage/methylation domain-containing protein [Gemmatimonadetes bacterium]|nr:prepilin-type N-terminal cleavage/methylation domain-containing protein [Gemmatimonadota bacterium]